MSGAAGPPGTEHWAYIRLVDYAAFHGVTYQCAYSWVRRGRLAAERRGSHWWVARDAPRPEGRAGAGAGAGDLQAGEQQGGLASTPAGAKPLLERPICAVCQERPARTRGRCARCYTYWWHTGIERPTTVLRRGPRGATAGRSKAARAQSRRGC